MVNPVLDLFNDITTVATMVMSTDCPVSDSEILFRLKKHEEEAEQEYAAAGGGKQTHIFMEGTLPAVAEGRTGKVFTREELGLPADEYRNRIFYLGFCPDLQGVFGTMDLYLNPRRAGGGWSSAIALMAGVPVLTLPDCDVAYNVGEKFVVQDFAALKATAARYITDPDFAGMMSGYAAASAGDPQDKMRQYVQSMVNGINAVLEGRK